MKPDSEFAIVSKNAVIQQTDGRMATVRATEEDIDNLILFDLALDYVNSPRIALCAADQASQQAIDEAIGFFQQLGKQVSVIDDIAGMCLMRTVCMLANEGAGMPSISRFVMLKPSILPCRAASITRSGHWPGPTKSVSITYLKCSTIWHKIMVKIVTVLHHYLFAKLQPGAGFYDQ